jgi:hypothetical protein
VKESSRPKGDLGPGPRIYRAAGQAVIRSSAEFAVSLRNHCQNRSALWDVLHDPDADTYDAASAIVAPKLRGSRTVNSANSPIWLSTMIVPPCSWVTMS